jgi:dihydrofolate reductase
VKVALVVAIAENGVIGRAGGLPWHISSDLKTFRAVTMGKPLIMGRRTFQSLKKPLDGRDNIVISRDGDFAAEGAIVERSFEAAMTRADACARARGADEIMVIGGTEVFRAALPVASVIYKTEVHGRPDGDAFFPDVDWSGWRERERRPLAQGPKDEFASTFIVLERGRAPAA